MIIVDTTIWGQRSKLEFVSTKKIDDGLGAKSKSPFVP